MRLGNVTVSICLLAACTWCFTLVSRVDSAEPSAEGFKPVASVEGLMHGQLVVFKEIDKAVSDPMAPNRAKQIEVLSEALAELSNINTLHSEKADYRNWAGQMRDASMQLGEAAKSGADDAKMNAIIETINAKCQACHDAYQ